MTAQQLAAEAEDLASLPKYVLSDEEADILKRIDMGLPVAPPIRSSLKKQISKETPDQYVRNLSSIWSMSGEGNGGIAMNTQFVECLSHSLSNNLRVQNLILLGREDRQWVSNKIKLMLQERVGQWSDVRNGYLESLRENDPSGVVESLGVEAEGSSTLSGVLKSQYDIAASMFISANISDRDALDSIASFASHFISRGYIDENGRLVRFDAAITLNDMDVSMAFLLLMCC